MKRIVGVSSIGQEVIIEYDCGAVEIINLNPIYYKSIGGHRRLSEICLERGIAILNHVSELVGK